MNDSRLDAGLRPGISTFPMKHQILTIRLSLQSVFRFCRQIYTQPRTPLKPLKKPISTPPTAIFTRSILAQNTLPCRNNQRFDTIVRVFAQTLYKYLIFNKYRFEVITSLRVNRGV